LPAGVVVAEIMCHTRSAHFVGNGTEVPRHVSAIPWAVLAR
jgi:hypothetical protein